MGPRRWELDLKRDDPSQRAVLGRGSEPWGLVSGVEPEPFVAFTIYHYGEPVLELRGGRLGWLSPGIVAFDEDLRQIPALGPDASAEAVAAAIADPNTECFVAGCGHRDMDPRPVAVRPFRSLMPVCWPHRRAIDEVLGVVG